MAVRRIAHHRRAEVPLDGRLTEQQLVQLGHLGIKKPVPGHDFEQHMILHLVRKMLGDKELNFGSAAVKVCLRADTMMQRLDPRIRLRDAEVIVAIIVSKGYN